MKKILKLCVGNPQAMRRSDQLVDEIEDRIATGFYALGERLDEQQLADEFGVSRTPIREALNQLSATGLVVIRPRRGAVVADVTPARLFEMFEVMAELEAMCGRLAARRMTPEEEQALRQAHLDCDNARDLGDSDEYYRRNELFHHLIYEGSHNAFLTEQAMALHSRLKPYRRLQLRVKNRMQTSFDEHQSIVDAISAGDGNLAAEALRSHVVVQGERFTDLVSSLAELTNKAA
jgi:DNA-binding GntR family transcriptional regulator